MNGEMHVLKMNKNWDSVVLPKVQKVVGCRLVMDSRKSQVTKLNDIGHKLK